MNFNRSRSIYQQYTYRVEPSLVQVNKKYDIVSKASDSEKICCLCNRAFSFNIHIKSCCLFSNFFNAIPLQDLLKLPMCCWHGYDEGKQIINKSIKRFIHKSSPWQMSYGLKNINLIKELDRARKMCFINVKHVIDIFDS